MTSHDLRAINTNLSYFTLRKIIGWCGLLLPWAVWAISGTYEPSISDYYYTVSGVIFTSVLMVVGVFLISYRGYDKEDEMVSDNVITWISGVLIMVVALVPTPYHSDSCPTPICLEADIWGYVHFGSAVGFFILMGYLSAFHFTRGARHITHAKEIRNLIYRTCGIGMWIVLGITGIAYFSAIKETFEHLVFWAEVILLVLFGISWLVKGKSLVDLGIQEEERG